MAERPKPSTSLVEKELDRADKQFQAFDENVKSLTLDRMNEAPRKDVEPIHKIAQSDISDSKDIYLKPTKTIPSREKFNEDYRKEYEFKKEYVFFTAENREVIGETIDMWVKPFPGMSAEEWKVPVGKPIWAPRYVAERIKGCSYHRLTMRDSITEASNNTQFYGQIVADSVVQRLDALPASKTKSIFMGAASF